MNDEELEQLLEQPETPEEKAALDAIPSDPEHVLDLALKRAMHPLPMK